MYTLKQPFFIVMSTLFWRTVEKLSKFLVMLLTNFNSKRAAHDLE